MAKYPIYSLKDHLVGFGAPMLQDNDAVAIRSLVNAVERDNSIYSTRPNDYSLYEIGEFDTVHGFIESKKDPRLVVNVIDLVRKEK